MGIKVNVSSKEGTSAPLDPIPPGKYHVVISEGEVVEVKEGKNAGKPYFNLELTVQEDGKSDQYAGRKIFTNVMLFEGAFYSLVQLLKSQGVPFDESGNFQVPGEEPNEVPEIEWFINKECLVRVKIQPERDHPKKPGEKLDARNEVKAFYPLSAVGTAVSGGTSNVTIQKPTSVLP